jgi:DNA repair exonuclease SbcCD ATPase subunit
MIYKNPAIKVEWVDVVENMTQERIKRVKAYFKQKYNTNNVKIITKALYNDSTAKLKSLDVSDKLLDPQYQKNLIKDYITDGKIDCDWQLLDRLDNKVNAEVIKNNPNKVTYNKWYIKRTEFSYFLSFGDDNVIDYEQLDGLTVIESEPKNFAGKTSAVCDLLLFLFFNTTTKSKTNAEIFNLFTDCDTVSVRGYINIDGDDYIIERTITRKKPKNSNEYNVKSFLKYTKILSDGTILNLSDDQRQSTENVIKNAIGTEEDFLYTILTTGKNLEDLIDSKPTARGQILTKFLGLESLKEKEDICKKMYSAWSKNLVSNSNNISTLLQDNITYEQKIESAEQEIIRLTQLINDKTEELKINEDRRDNLLSIRNNDIDAELLKANPDALRIQINELTKSKSEIESKLIGIKLKEPSDYYLEDAHEKVKKDISELTFSNRLLQNDISTKQQMIKNYEEGKICSQCGRPFDADKISIITEKINELNISITGINEKISDNSQKKSLFEEMEKKYSVLKSEYDKYEKEKLIKTKYELEIAQFDIELGLKTLLLEKYNNNKKKMEDNEKIDTELLIIKTKIQTNNGEINQSRISIETNNNNIRNTKNTIETNNELIKKIKEEEKYIKSFEVYMQIFGKNGISKVILKNMIPLLNQELDRILSDSCYFTIELLINEKNELEFIMIDNETRVAKPLYSGSGYERTIASLALRSVLTKVSTLPKPNIIVMDEIFGKVADENLDMIGEFFKKIKLYFEHILVISHNPLVKNWCDNVILIKKEDNISSIDYIKTKDN